MKSHLFDILCITSSFFIRLFSETSHSKEFLKLNKTLLHVSFQKSSFYVKKLIFQQILVFISALFYGKTGYLNMINVRGKVKYSANCREFHALHNPYLGLQKKFQKKPKNAEEYYSKAPLLTSIHERTSCGKAVFHPAIFFKKFYMVRISIQY